MLHCHTAFCNGNERTGATLMDSYSETYSRSAKEKLRGGDERRDDPTPALAGMGERIATEVHAAALPGCAEHARHRRLDALTRGATDNLHHHRGHDLKKTKGPSTPESGVRLLLDRQDRICLPSRLLAWTSDAHSRNSIRYSGSFEFPDPGRGLSREPATPPPDPRQRDIVAPPQ